MAAKEDLWAREWHIATGYDNDPYGQIGGGVVLRDPDQKNIFKLKKLRVAGLKAKAYCAIPVDNSTTAYWKNAVFFEMGSRPLSLPTVKRLTKPYPLYAPPPGPLSQENEDAEDEHKTLVKACMKEVENNTLRLVAGIPVTKSENKVVVEYIFLYCIKNALQNGTKKKKKHLLLIDLRDTSMGAGEPHEGGSGSGYSSRP